MPPTGPHCSPLVPRTHTFAHTHCLRAALRCITGDAFVPRFARTARTNTSHAWTPDARGGSNALRCHTYATTVLPAIYRMHCAFYLPATYAAMPAGTPLPTCRSAAAFATPHTATAARYRCQPVCLIPSITSRIHYHHSLTTAAAHNVSHASTIRFGNAARHPFRCSATAVTADYLPTVPL